MKVLFFYRGFESLAIEYLSSVLKEGGHKTDLIFDPGFDENAFFSFSLFKNFNLKEKMMEKAKHFSPDLAAFSTVTYTFPFVRELASIVKEELEVPTIVGGVHPTLLPDEVIKEKGIDMICLGEGDYALLELVDKMEENGDPADVKNIWFKQDGRIIKNPIRNLIEDLDSLPVPDKDLFYKFGCFTDRAYVIAGRGCPYKCTYCFNHQYQGLYKGKGRYVRMRSVENIIEELRNYVKKYKIKSVAFEDDTFTLNHKWVMDFCEIYREEIGLPFRCLVRANTITREVARALKEAGCDWVHMGLESGDEQIRYNVLKRKISDEQMVKAGRLLKEAGLKLKLLSIFGLPDETPKTMWKTVEMNELIGPDAACSYLFTPYPLTELAEYSIKKGLLSEEEFERIKSGAGSMHKDFFLDHPYKELAKNIKLVLPIYNRTPAFFKPVLKRLMRDKEHSKVLKTLLYYLSIPMYTGGLRSGGEAFYKLRESISMVQKSYRYYKNQI